MQLTKYWVIASSIIATTWRSEIVIADETSSRFIVEDLVKIVTSCYGDHVNAVGLAGNLPDNLIRTLNQQLIPVALIDDTILIEDPLRVVLHPRHKLPVFIIGASSIDHLANIVMTNIEYSIWWNRMASYLILDSSPGCRNALFFLHVAWRFNLINAKVMCDNHRGSARFIVNYNPFTSEAPVPWLRTRIYIHTKNDHPFSVFIRRYGKDDAICVNLDFDKTADLGDDEIREHGSRLERHIKNQKINPFTYNFVVTNGRIMRNLFDVLHANAKFTGPVNATTSFD